MPAKVVRLGWVRVELKAEQIPKSDLVDGFHCKAASGVSERWIDARVFRVLAFVVALAAGG